MNIRVVQNAVGELSKMLGNAEDALRQIESEVFHHRISYERGVYDEPRFALEANLRELHDILLVVLEAAELPETRASLLKSWSEFTSEANSLRKTVDDDQYENSVSPPLNFLARIINGLRISSTEGISSEDAWTLNRLEEMLRDTPGLVHGRNCKPETEKDLQKIMHDYLRACFPDFRLNPSIGGTIKNFKPDCGIATVSAAIEFKIVHTREQVAVAFSGIAEDSAGYKGSKDWTRFYAVLYQGQPFMLESHLRHDVKRIGAATWKPIVVNGPTKSKGRRNAVKPTTT